MQYASLGDIVFKVYSYLEHRETNEYAVAKHRTIFAPSSLQFLGDELLSLEVKVGFHRDFCDPLEEYQKLKDIAKEGLPKKLIIAEQVYGDFVIESITAEVKQVDMWGKPVAIYCTMRLTEYREKKLQTREIKTTTRKKAPAKRSKTSQQQQQVQPSQYKPIITR
ncbi:phage tail protein [Thermocrinis sp.]|jgi:phage protein U|uniref:phage tail protein n=1 Tax=Thermocrinis sp. TaxID=2024383 RepID=UPI003C0C0AA8